MAQPLGRVAEKVTVFGSRPSLTMPVPSSQAGNVPVEADLLQLDAGESYRLRKRSLIL